MAQQCPGNASTHFSRDAETYRQKYFPYGMLCFFPILIGFKAMDFAEVINFDMDLFFLTC